ncbi:plasmid mobilization relaxosome protein MobC, partial [Klebsiella pneumoniae]|uniref:plasmid mobilization relaxosome protein MobC n=1 Tax=Klebsiella pneumoniae TaxID=573 RepID=UPI0039693A41
RCNVNRLEAMMNQAWLDEKPTRAGRLPSISPALLRQLAGMGNNLNQIARKVKAFGAGHVRGQIVTVILTLTLIS